MSWRDILVFADGSGDGMARMRLAQAVAGFHQAHLEAVAVVQLPSPLYGPGRGALAEIYAGAVKTAREEGAQAIAALRALTPQTPDQVTLHTEDAFLADVRALAARAARTADLVILGQPEDFDRSDLGTEILVGALLGGGRPCLMFPRWIEPHAWGKRALIAWKGTPEAARAVQAALPLLKLAEKVRLCLVNPRTERTGEDPRSVARLASYLTRHGVQVEEPSIRESREGPEKLFASEIDGFNADLLVMGAYSRPRFQEIVFGGMTAAMIREAKIPVLLMH
jgi:nucleotide-binding universal stress UspA family protein